MNARAEKQEVGNLRLPVPFFDLLMVLLVCFLVFVSPARPDGVATGSVDIPVARGGDPAGGANLLPVSPHRGGEGWTFELVQSGQKLTAGALAAHAAKSKRKVVIVASAATPLQTFIDMQAELAAHKVPFGLAVRSEETKP